MSEFEEINSKLDTMRSNISQMLSLLTKDNEDKCVKISSNVFEYQKQTTLLSKEICSLIKDISIGKDIHKMKMYRTLISDFLTNLTNFSAIQRTIIESASHETVDGCRTTEIEAMIASLSPLINNGTNEMEANNRLTWFATFGILSVAVIGGLALFKKA